MLIEASPIAVTVDPLHGGRLSSLKIGGTELLVTKATSPFDWGAFPMVPFAGRIRHGIVQFSGSQFQMPVNASPHSIHGSVFASPWKVEHHTQTEILLSTTLGEDWPFHADVFHRVSVSSKVVRCELTVHARDRMPIQVGWHPWFVQPKSAVTDFAVMLLRDEEGITQPIRVPPHDPPVDDCFMEPRTWPRLTIEFCHIEVASDCTHWVRFDAPSGDVCIEPQSGPPNGVNTQPDIVGPNEAFTRWMEIRLLEQLPAELT